MLHPTIYVQDNSAGYLALLDGVPNNWENTGTSIAYENSAAGTGTLFLEDFGGFPFNFNKQTVYARQLDMEGVGTKATNNGGSLWVLGIKIEGSGTIIQTEANAKTEVLGGNLYPDHVLENGAAFVVSDSEASFVYSVSAYSALPAPNPSPQASGKSYSDFQIQVTETQGSKTLNLDTTTVPKRGDGAMMPLYTSKRL